MFVPKRAIRALAFYANTWRLDLSLLSNMVSRIKPLWCKTSISLGMALTLEGVHILTTRPYIPVRNQVLDNIVMPIPKNDRFLMF